MKTLSSFKRHGASARACASVFAVMAAYPATSVLAQGQTVVALKEVVVTATRYAQDELSAPSATTVLTGSQILASGATDANDAIRRLTGIASRTDLRGGGDYTLDLRGFGATADQNVVVVVDGIRISENELTTARLSAISSEMIESIEIVRGGSSVQWGEGASAGVIQVVLKRSAEKGVHGVAGLQLESNNGRDARGQINVGGEQMSFDANVRSFQTDGYRDNSANKQDSVSLGLSGNSGTFKYRLRVSQDDQDSRFPGPLSFTEFAANPKQTKTPNDFGRNQETRWTGGFEYQSGSLNYALDVGTRKRSVSSHYVGFDSQTNSEGIQLSPRMTYTSQLSSAALALLLGGDVQRWNYSGVNNFGQNETATQDNNAWFTSVDVLTASNTRLTAGYRSEQVRKVATDPANSVAYNRPDSLTAWDVGVNQAVLSDWNVYGRLAKSFRLANVDENRYLTTALNPQLTRDTELGVKWHPQPGFSASGRLFQQNAVDEIAYDPVAFSNVNLDPSQRRGLELEAQAKLSKTFTLNGTLQTVKSRFTAGPNADLEMPLVSSLSGALRLGWMPDKHRTVTVGVQHLGESRFGDDNANTCAARIPSSTLWDARYAYVYDKLEVALALTNLSDVKSYSYAYSCATGSLYPNPGRKIALSAKYSF